MSPFEFTTKPGGKARGPEKLSPHDYRWLDRALAEGYLIDRSSHPRTAAARAWWNHCREWGKPFAVAWPEGKLREEPKTYTVACNVAVIDRVFKEDSFERIREHLTEPPVYTHSEITIHEIYFEGVPADSEGRCRFAGELYAWSHLYSYSGPQASVYGTRFPLVGATRF